VSLRERRTPEERRAFIQSITATSDSDLVEFLAEEVLEQQPPHIRNFLLATSVLHQINPDLAARLAGIHDGGRILADLENRGLFTYRLDSTEGRYRYHGLFRDFLERRLIAERTEGEVAALHIHAASYFETHAAWPEAIHHYMEAGLQPQAARLIAKFGEDLMSGGRLPLIDEWLAELPRRTIADNARLSLLYGETSGVRGDWQSALGALQRARQFFSRKGDRRMEALACSKLSTVYNNLGDVVRCAEVAIEGLELAPEDAHATRIRLQGNVAVTTTWLASVERAELACKRVAVESTSRGYEQYAAIAYHNLGVMTRYAGRLDESLNHLERAARFWDASPSNPFADNSELVQTLLAMGRVGRAAEIAEAAVHRTRPWPKPLGEARFGVACVLAQQGRFPEAIETLRDILQIHGNVLGPVTEKAISLLIECLYLHGGAGDEMRSLLARLESMPRDPRLAPTTNVAAALAAHRIGDCGARCSQAEETLTAWSTNGAALSAFIGRVQLAILGFDHDVSEASRRMAELLSESKTVEVFEYMRWWLRRLTPHIGAWAVDSDAHTLAGLLHSDSTYWTGPIASLLPTLKGDAREAVIAAIRATADPATAQKLRAVDGSDVQDLRRQLLQSFAERLFIRSLGTITLHRESWNSPAFLVGRRRMRLLLGLLIAHYDSGLTRDQAIDILWPDADPSSAVNSLNQTVFQLRRLIEPNYREGDSPQYIVSTVDAVHLNRDLVQTDLSAFREVARQANEASGMETRAELADQMVGLVRGEFLADLKYEDWVSAAQISVHAEVRSTLLPIALGEVMSPSHETILRAGCALALIDPYDETAHMAMVKHLASSGRRSQARALLARFAKRLQEELDEEPSADLRTVATLVGVGLDRIVVD
ncbi:MAG: BTAD domain-containing putative transcriptional regulator, partial [Gammaproteobacteria bacterium]